MMKHRWALSALSLVLGLWSTSTLAADQVPVKEWTMLTYLNGHNNLDSFGAMNVKQMQQVGSSDQVNIVVQWASSKAKTTKRIFVKKGSFDVIEDLPRVDMGNYQSLISFVQWGAAHYPAKHYFVNVWNHGGGWHLQQFNNSDLHAQDISWDDFSGHHITTEQLGQSLAEISKGLGQKVDIYGSDACLMAMAEVAGELQDSVQYMVGSEETEPGEGWPYATFLTRFVGNATAPAADIAKALVEEYYKAYNGGVYGNSSITFSAMDLSKMPAYANSVANLGHEIASMSSASIQKALAAAESAQSYAYSDYKDAYDFISKLESGNSALGINAATLADVKASISSLVIASAASSAYSDSHGLAMWIPTSSYDWSNYKTRYQGLRFDRDSQWSTALAKFF